jgi:1-acyl-sn-glycerol-3-phosphate acyltransferase
MAISKPRTRDTTIPFVPSAHRSLFKRAWYSTLRVVCRFLAVILFRVRCFDRKRLPHEGGALLLANHQSYLDPVLIGLACDRRLNYLARATLFRWKAFRWLIQSLDAIPIEREGLGVAGFKETLRRLRRAEVVLLFPEGTRTPDGAIGPMLAGVGAVARRAMVPLVAVGIDGAFEAWPRARRLPRLATITVQLSEPLWPREQALLDDQQLLVEIRRRLEAAHARARWQRLGAAGRRRPSEARRATGEMRREGVAGVETSSPQP